LKKGDPPTAKYQNAAAQVWDLSGAPTDVIGGSAGNAGKLNLKPAEFPFVQVIPGSPIALFDNDYGVQNGQELWTVPVASASSTSAPWLRIAARSDDVTGIDVRGDEIFLLSHKDAPTFRVLGLRAGQTIKDAQTLIQARPERIIESIHAASDAL